MKKAIIVLVAMILVLPAITEARVIHGFACNQCHKPGVSYTDLGNTSTNICLSCHNSSAPQGLNLAMGQGWVNPNGLFQVSDGSNAMGAVEGIAVSETSHLWAGNMADGAAAGAAEPTTYLTELNGRYGISRGKVTCSRCHDPHGDNDINTLLLKVPMDNDELCKACHAPWAGLANDPVDPAFNDGLESHPMVADFATTVANRNSEAAAASEPQDPYKTAVDNTLAAGPNGDIRLVNGAVSCTSCHHLHFSDSDSTTVDGRGNQTNINLNGGDGKLLRTDGATRANKSALCQACHNYREHGDDGGKHSITAIPGVTATTKVGCLECHSGHSFNNNDPQYYVLRSSIGAPYNVTFVAPYNYSAKPASHDQAIPWQDGSGANGYCEKCHGDASLLAGSQHTNAAKCMTCHFHNSSSTGYSFEPGANVAICGDCHGFPPHINARGDRATNPSYEGGYAYISASNNYSLASNFKDESLTPHNAHAAGGVFYADGTTPQGIDTDYRMGDSEVACSTCHGVRPSHNTGSTSVMGTYEDLEFDARATVDGQIAPAYDGAGRETCNNVYCHSNGGRRAGDNPTESTRIWSFIETPYTGGGTNSGWKNGKGKLITALPAFGSAAECSTCHGNSDTTMTSRGNSPAHNKHLLANYTCNVCHVYTATDNISVPKAARDVSKNAGNFALGTHVNNKIDVYFDPAHPAPIGAGTYTAATGTCTVYCHTDGNGGAAVTTADWDGSGSDCKFCHKSNVASGTVMSTGSHGQHINGTVPTVGHQMGCVECHNTTVSGDLTVSTPANHINGAKNLGIASNGGASSCDNIYCHSDGNLDGTITYKLNGTDYQWGNNGTLGCASCHGNGTVAYPTYANGGIGNNSNSHAAHVGGGIACGKCHASVSTDGTSIDGTTPANHVNQSIEVVAGNGASFTWTAGTETCSANACHADLQWGQQSLSCGACHQNATADTDDFTYNNGTQARVATNEWSFSGHGKTSGSYELTGHPAANFPGAVTTGDPCKYCHDAGVTHGDTNYFRLRINTVSGVTAGDLNTVCLGCHDTSAAGVDPDGAGTAYASKTATIKVDKYHQGSKHISTTGGRWCWDCHDPHGDASAVSTRIQMIQRRAQVNPDVNGVPASLTGTDIVFYNNTLGADPAGGFARDAAPYAAGICNACHTSPNVAQYTSTTGKGTHGTGKCTTCHQHSKDDTYNANAFQGSGCNGCHGSQATGQYWPDGSGGSIPYANDQVGAHQNHILAISMDQYGLDIAGLLADPGTDAKQQAICAFCHKDPGGSGHDANGGSDNRADVYQDSDDTGAKTDVFTKYGPAASDSADDITGANGDQAYNFTNGTCSNLACHDRTVTPTSWNTPPGSPTCAVCHVASGNGLGRHDTHVTTKAYACTECHTNQGTFPSATTNLGHANGSVELAWNNAGSFEATYGGSSVTYSGALAYGDGNFGTCANAACHNNRTSTAWNVAVSSACTICHTDDNSNGSAVVDPTSGLHNYNATYPDVEGHDGTFNSGSSTCISCHNSASISGGHVNGSVTTLVAGNLVSNAGQTINLNGAGPADDTCTANCHADNNRWARQWSANAYSAATTPGNARCDVCHGQLNAWVSGMGTGAVVNHDVAGINNAGNHATCATCHVLPDAPYVWATNHEDGMMAYNSNADLGYDTVTGSCSNPTSGCHGNDPAHTLGVSTTFTGETPLAGSGGSCVTCHGNGSGNEIWPDGVANNSSRVAYADDQVGAHANHVQAIGIYMGLGSDTSLYSQTDQKTKICLFCHPSPGAAGHSTDNAPLSTVDVLGATQFLKYDGAGASATDAVSGAYSSGTCSNLACHDRQTTPTSWTTPPGAPTCAICHVAAGNSLGRHDTHVTTKGYGCTECHPNQGTFPGGTTGLQHGNGAVNLAWNVAGSFENTYGGASVTYSGGLTYGDGAFGTCASAACHNNKTSTAWDVAATANCVICHTDVTTDTMHTNHTGATGIFGLTIGCNRCHPAEVDWVGKVPPASGHVNGTFSVNGGTVIDGTTYTYSGYTYPGVKGTCGTNTCHQDGKGGAPYNSGNASYNWSGTPVLATCTACHNSNGMPTSGAHNTHLGSVAWGPHPTGSTNCGECHLANSSNTDMTGKATHINGTISLAGPFEVASGAMATDTTATTCNNCHGGLTAANAAGGAKKSWAAATRLACESCHGNYTDANTKADGTGSTAPHNAGTGAGEYTQSGHGKTGVVQACTDCHSNTAAGHLDGTSGDDKRLKTVNSQTYGARYAVASIDFCGLACHATSMKLHYTNGASGTSYPPDNQLDCITCHNPHGQNLDATSNALATMIRPTIDGKDIIGFYNKGTQNNYYVDPPNNGGNNRYGICQACHDPTDSSASGGTIGNFNQSIATPTHQGSQLCTDCHKHTDDPAFQASGGGCDGCHGYPPVQNSTWISTYTSGKLEDYQGGGRAHTVAAHLSTSITPADGWTPCTPCHTETDHNMALGVGALATERDNSGNWGTVGSRYPRVRLDATLDKGGSATFNMGNRNTTDGMGYCSNLSCHFGESPKWDCEPANSTNDPQ